jgi:hypothetical protein
LGLCLLLFARQNKRHSDFTTWNGHTRFSPQEPKASVLTKLKLRSQNTHESQLSTLNTAYTQFYTMTVIKATSAPLLTHGTAKDTPKKAVSLSKACKYSFPPKAVSTMQCDSCLQSTDKRRNYMRRGSRSPSMLKLSIGDLESFEEVVSVEKTNTHFIPSKERRMSLLMSALKINFEKASIIEPNVTSQIRRMPMVQKRR